MEMIRCKIELHDIGNTCPVCGEQALDAAFDERDDGKHFDTFACDNCGVLVTYISPDDGRGEYHEFHNGEITIELEWSIPHISLQDDLPDELKSQGFYLTVDGVTSHVLGDPNMSPKEIEALEKMIRAARNMQDVRQSASDNPSSEG
jgi:predicted RNA-binding Zn-ribbon protein involved in translation (DUF1610 family)